MRGYERAIIGGLGGLAAVCVKFLGQDYYIVAKQAANLTGSQITSYIIGYSILTPILIFLGSLLSWVSDEKNRLKLLAIGVAAPALITTWAGGIKTDSQIALNSIVIDSAYAAEVDSQTTSQERSFGSKIVDGVKIFFGVGKEIERYWVIVGSFKDRKEAQEYADLINQKRDDLNAFVGIKVPPNQYYPVIVGHYAPLSEAKVVKEKALKLDIIKDAYLSSGAKR